MPKPELEREELIDKVEAMMIMGITGSSKIWRALNEGGNEVSINTVARYISIAARRMRQRYDNVDNSRILKREIRDLDFLEKQAWTAYRRAANGNERTGALNTILKVKERRAKMLGFDSENLNVNVKKTLEDLIKEDDHAEAKQTTDRRLALGTEQAPGTGEVST